MPDRETLHLAELLGDGISAELSSSVHVVADSLPIRVHFHPVDLGLQSRRKNAAACYDAALAAMRDHGIAIKYPTVTEAESPNKILRERCGFSVIHRPVATIPGVKSRHDGKVDLHIVRIAVGGTYEDAGRRIGNDVAVSIRVIERRPSREAALFAFRLARRLSCGVVSSSKYTIQRATDGLFEEIVGDVASDFPDVPHSSELFDALLYKLVLAPEAYRVVVTPNEYGDFLSDMACGMVGSIGLGASANYSFDAQGLPALAMFDPAGGTAPDIAGKGVCNPAAALLAFSMLLTHAGFRGLGTLLDDAVRLAIADGDATRDLGGKLGTKEFTAAVCRRLGRIEPAPPRAGTGA
ncbi:MAG TPA: isocitrate/isopropylmalate family dehydrogenase [Planctomycetota bacterium]|nr:isocitrate/isopropylmalate family dehydrogenase [Planctomycetota bacterium]